jgi:hypothetical protein
VLALVADDQAPGVDLVGSGNDAWRRLDSVDGEDLDDVYAVTLGKGDRLDVSIASLSADPVAALLFDGDTEDVFGQLDHALACRGGEEVGCPTAGLHFEASERATYLLDLLATGASGDYRLTWTVRNAAGLPIEVTTAACSPNGDGVQDRCAWSAGAISGWAVRSFVTSGASLVAERDGAGVTSWDGGDSDPGSYTLRVLYTEAGGRALLLAFTLTLDERRPRIADANAAPNPFEPRPRTATGTRRHSRWPPPSGGARGSSSTAPPPPTWSGSWSAASWRPGGSGFPGPGRPRRAHGSGEPSRTCSRPPTSPATPPGPSATASVCSESQLPDNGLTGLPVSARVALHLAEGPSSAGRVSPETSFGQGGVPL